MGRLEENQNRIIAESIDIFDSFIRAAKIEVKDEPRFQVYSDWKTRFEMLIIKWALEKFVIFFTVLFALVFIWRMQYSYEVTGISKVLASFGILAAAKRINAVASVAQSDDASNAIIRYINTNQDYFIFPEEDNHGGEELQSQEQREKHK